MRKILMVLALSAGAFWPLGCGKNLSPPAAPVWPDWDVTAPATLSAGSYNYGNVHVHSGATLYLKGPGGAEMNAAATLNLTGDFTLDAGATIEGGEEGYAAEAGPGMGSPGSGGGHGGAGGGSYSIYGLANDDSAGPTLMGSGGTSPGGALLRINATGATLNGLIDVTGGGGITAGAGGGLWVQANLIFGSGEILAGGGSGSPYGGGGGIVVLSVHSGYYFTGTVSVVGGIGGTAGSAGFFDQEAF